MKQLISVIAIAALCCIQAVAQGGARGQSDLTLDGKKVSVEYGRPALKGRDVLSMIQPGQEWRTGLDAPTTLSTELNLKFGDTVVPQGSYILSTKLVEAGKWHLILRREDKSPVAEVPLVFQKTDRPAEQLTIELRKKADGGELFLHWGTSTLSTDFRKA